MRRSMEIWYSSMPAALKKAAAVQYLNEQERANSKFRCKKTVIIPNTVEFRERTQDIDQSLFRFIYVGRYDVTVKGLDLMVSAFISLKDWCRENNVVLELYGPIEENPALDALKKEIAELKEKTGYFNYIDKNMNESYKPTIQKLVDQGRLEGNEKGELMLTTDMMRILTILDRAGVFN